MGGRDYAPIGTRRACGYCGWAVGQTPQGLARHHNERRVLRNGHPYDTGKRCPGSGEATEPLDDATAAPTSVPPPRAERDVDEVAVQRCIDGELAAIHLTRAERERAVRALVGLGLSDRQVARRISWSAASVCQFRHRNGIPAALPSGRQPKAAVA